MPLTPARFKGQFYFLLITISSFPNVRNLCCVAFPSFAALWCFYFGGALQSSLFPAVGCCVLDVCSVERRLCHHSTYVTIQLFIASSPDQRLILIFKEALKIGILIVSQCLYQLGYFTLQFTENPATKLLEQWGIYLLTN